MNLYLILSFLNSAPETSLSSTISSIDSWSKQRLINFDIIGNHWAFKVSWFSFNSWIQIFSNSVNCEEVNFGSGMRNWSENVVKAKFRNFYNVLWNTNLSPNEAKFQKWSHFDKLHWLFRWRQKGFSKVVWEPLIDDLIGMALPKLQPMSIW